MEDKEQIRRVSSAVLTRSGYTVIQASRPSDAIRVFDSDPTGIDLLLTDVVMPEMGGRELAQRLTSGNPGVRVLYVSGYTNDAVLHHGVVAPGVSFIEKPLTPDKLIRKVREVARRITRAYARARVIATLRGRDLCARTGP